MRRKLFVDSFFYIALLNHRDQYHDRAAEVSQTIGGSQFWTTDLVLVETANGCRSPSLRLGAARLIHRLATEPDTRIIHLTQDLFEKAMGRYESRLDKAWSLTDCLSFVVMEENGIEEALTGDAHYSQAGFRRLM
jgi:predicted nucleic acid-binding protein